MITRMAKESVKGPGKTGCDVQNKKEREDAIVKIWKNRLHCKH